MLTNPSKTTTRDWGAGQWDENPLISKAVAKSRIVGDLDELRLVTTNGDRRGLDEGSLTPLRKPGLELNIEVAFKSDRDNSGPSPKSVPRNSSIVWLVRLSPLMTEGLPRCLVSRFIGEQI